MKKSVRIRKALSGETPGYYNKTAKFLQKAQMGMEVNSVSRDPQRINLIYQNVYKSLKQSVTPDLVYSQLLGEYALDQETALSMIQSALSKLSEEGYADSELMNEDTEESNAPQEQVTNNEDQSYEEEQRLSDDAEQEELAMSDEGYYDEEEASNNTNSSLETEQDEEESAFRFGGYKKQEGGESDDDYSDNDDLNDDESEEQNILSQYNNPGKNKTKQPFSLEDLMAVTPGMQKQSFPDLSYYMGNYVPSYDSYQPQNFLPEAKQGGQLPKAQDGGILAKLNAYLSPGSKFFNKNNPITNFSGIRKMAPVFSAIGQGMTKLPLIGSKLKPKLETTFTQNRTELFSILNGNKPKPEIFSQSGTRGTGIDGSLTANKLLLYQEDVENIVKNIEGGKSTFTYADVNPKAELDGLISGIYPMNSKVLSGVDDNGFKFFEIKHTFGPNEQLPYGTTPAKAKELTVKNRFYFSTDATTGKISVFDPLGNPLSTGIKTKYDITRPLGTTAARVGKYLTTDAGLLETNTYDKRIIGYEGGYPQRSLDVTEQRRMLNEPNYEIDQVPQYKVTGKFGTPYPNYMDGPDEVKSFYPGQVVLPKTLGRLREVSDIAPATLDRLTGKGKAGRLLENIGMSTWLPQFFGLGNPFRTNSRNVETMSLPTYGYRNTAMGPEIVDPAKEGSYGSDIKNAINYNYRLGLKSSLLIGGGLTLGYKTYDAIANPCQCDDQLQANYQPKDKFGNCTCGTDVGPSRTLDPTGIENTEEINQKNLTFPDSMQFLIQKGIAPTDYNYWRYRDSLNLDKSKNSFDDDFAKGGVTKNQFIKKFTSKFQEGGSSKSSSLGQGKRSDNLTNDVENKLNIFKSKIKNNSNVALTQEIYKNAQGNPQILNMLMQDGPKKNLAEEEQMQTAQYGAFVNNEQGGFVDMDSENPLVKFVYGGNETEYYEPYDLPMAQNGMNIMNQAGEQRVVADELSFDEWAAGEKEDFATTHPGSNYEAWKVSDQAQEEYETYEDFYGRSVYDYMQYGKKDPSIDQTNKVTTQKECGPGTVWDETYKACIPIMRYSPRVVRGQSNFFNNVIPINPFFGYAGSYKKQKSNPYYLDNRNPYTGQLTNPPIASYITKRGILGRPKKQLDIYNVGSEGVDLTKLLELAEQNKKNNRNKDFSSMNNMRINRGERKAERQLERGIRKGMDQPLEGEITSYNESPGRDNYLRTLFPKKEFTRSGKSRQYGGENMQMGGFNPFGLGNGISNGINNPNAFKPNLGPNELPNPFASTKENPYVNPLTGQSSAVVYNPSTGAYDETKKSENNFSQDNSKLVGVENKIKNMSNIDPEAGVNAFNAGARGVLGVFDRRSNAKNERDLLLNTVDPMNLYASANELDRGDHQDFGSKSGLYRYDQQGQDRSSRATFGQYGGYMQEGGFYEEPNFEEDEEVYMSPDELEQFLQLGGQVEYL